MMKRIGKKSIKIISVLAAVAAAVGLYTMKGDREFDDLSVSESVPSESFRTESVDVAEAFSDADSSSDTNIDINTDSVTDTASDTDTGSDTDKNSNTEKSTDTNKNTDTASSTSSKNNSSEHDAESDVDSETESGQIFPYRGVWNLILVNKYNPIPEGYDFSLVELDNGKQVDSRIYDDLQEMFAAAESVGIYPIAGEAYRTTEEQEEIMQSYIDSYIAQGYSREGAEAEAKKWVALPGTSEHQLGLALDINADTNYSSNEEVYNWLAENAYKYGFILRYPLGKESITGIDYEPWHYRYVGRTAAEQIYESGECLEEYLSE